MMPPVPGPFEQAFLDDLPYDPEVLLFDRLLEVDRDKSLVRCRWTTSDSEPITRSQRGHPVRHPRHVAGSLMVHATGMLGFIHAYYVLGLRHREGWIGYGTHMYKAVFRKLVPPGDEIIATGWAKRSRMGQVRHFLRYAFEFRHEGDLCYESEQAAMWLQTGDESVAAELANAGA